jgi:uncharacterized protein YdeI (YjbR/CyaY-like superfamily)
MFRYNPGFQASGFGPRGSGSRSGCTDVEMVYFETPADLRRWFARHHRTAKELWAGFYRKDCGRRSITWPEAVDEALCVGWIDGVRRNVDAISYAVRLTPRNARSAWSAVNIARAKALIASRRMKAQGRKAFAARNRAASGYSMAKRHGVSLPAGFAREFRAQTDAWTFFSSQPAWYRRNATWWVVSAKKDETRRRRLAALIEDSRDHRRLRMLGGPRTTDLQ